MRLHAQRINTWHTVSNQEIVIPFSPTFPVSPDSHSLEGRRIVNKRQGDIIMSVFVHLGCYKEIQ